MLQPAGTTGPGAGHDAIGRFEVCIWLSSMYEYFDKTRVISSDMTNAKFSSHTKEQQGNMRRSRLEQRHQELIGNLTSTTSPSSSSSVLRKHKRPRPPPYWLVIYIKCPPFRILTFLPPHTSHPLRWLDFCLHRPCRRRPFRPA